MPFIDWNGDGEIDAADITISFATEDDKQEESIPQPEQKRNSSAGCLASVMLIILCVLGVLAGSTIYFCL